ncbi:MAG: YihY/virulence factor BrkB family protein [Nocardioidaceae bacterium]|nr:YihY/virulence factor BrkB family protein [Nocardioidaceae bacterium]
MSSGSDLAASAVDAEVPGSDATTPRAIPARGWWQVTKRAWAEAKTDQVPLLAAGVAFFGFLSLFPAIIAAVMTYGLVANPRQIRDQISGVTDAMPKDARSLVMGQIDTITSTPQQSLGIGVVVALALALWSASGGVGNLISAVNLAYDEEETRGFVRRKALALGMTLGAIIFALVAIGLVAVAPAVFDALGLSTAGRLIAEVVRWVLLLALVMAALAVVFRVAPDRDAPKFAWVTIGAIIATVIWLIASLGFSFYVDNFGSYSKTYGSLAAVVVMLLWLWITCYIVLLGAEINAESEAQTVEDTTKGPAKPLGDRGAVKADSLPPAEGSAEEAVDRRRT